MGSIYWLVKIGSGKRLADWIIDNYPGINYVCFEIEIPDDLREQNVISRGKIHIPFHRATVISFQDFDAPDVDIKFKLMNADLIIDHKAENPGQHW